MQNYFLHHALRHDDTVSIYGEDYHHLKNVRRTSEGDRFTAVLRGTVYLLEVVSVHRDRMTCSVLESREAHMRGSVRIIVYQALLKSVKMDLVVSRLGELGVEVLVPVWTERTTVREPPGEGRGRRWEKLVREAARISGAERLMQIAAPVHLAEVPERFAHNGGIGLLFREPSGEEPDQGAVRLFEFLSSLPPESTRALHLIFGPEGGFSVREIEMLARAGAQPVSLGRMTLRSETAALLGTGIIRLYTGENA